MSANRLVVLTPYSGPKKILRKTIMKCVNQLNSKDFWIIILDNQNINDYIDLKKKYHSLILINYTGPRGAGNCRNAGLDYIIKNINGKFLLLPLDGDDKLINNAVSLIKKKMKKSNSNIISFAHQKKMA